MKNRLRFLLEQKAVDNYTAIPSFCTANRLAIKACLSYAKKNDKLIVLEATSNQVNQDGGYTGMQPKDYVTFVHEIAEEVDYPKANIIFGGDHLGPLVWSHLPEAEAMSKAEVLVAEYVKAGYTKIHLDTSMKLKSDDPDGLLSDDIIAARGARLMIACEKAFAEYKKKNPDAEEPVYIIGSEVPIPGGAEYNDEQLTVTNPGALENTFTAYQRIFKENGLEKALTNIIGIVAQPGVEFSDSDIHVYSHEKAQKLSEKIKEIPTLVLEGHSTDYQPRWALKEMAEDGIAILKVGPALTFAVRAGLYALSYIEDIVIKAEKRSNFRKIVKDAMNRNPSNWQKHYHGTDQEIEIKKDFSYSDRIRYYFSQPEVEKAINILFTNINDAKSIIPGGLLHQFMPEQYYKIRDSKLDYEAENLVLDWVGTFIEDYYYAGEK